MQLQLILDRSLTNCQTQMQVEELVCQVLKNTCLTAFFGAINGTHIEIKELNEHYSDHINRKRYFSINMQAVCQILFLVLQHLSIPGQYHHF